MNFKSLYTVPADVTVKGAKAVGRGALYVTDYAEVGVDKVVGGVKTGTVATVVAVVNHRQAKATRLELRKAARAQRKAHNAEVRAAQAKNDSEKTEVATV